MLCSYPKIIRRRRRRKRVEEKNNNLLNTRVQVTAPLSSAGEVVSTVAGNTLPLNRKSHLG